jgi:hypothetical protein
MAAMKKRLSTVDELLAWYGSKREDQPREVIAVLVADYPSLDVRRTLLVARAISDLDICRGAPEKQHIFEAFRYVKDGLGLPDMALKASGEARDRIMAVRAQLALNGHYRPLRMRDEGSAWACCPLCGVMGRLGMMDEPNTIDEHIRRCAMARVARWHAPHGCDTEVIGTMAMTEAPCGCRYKMFNDNPLALSVKPCLEGSKILASKEMAKHLGLTKETETQPVAGRKARTWSPR